MEKIIIATLLPAAVIFTVYLFNVSVQELIDCKYGLNTNYFKPIAFIVMGVYIMYSVPPMIFRKPEAVHLWPRGRTPENSETIQATHSRDR